MQKVKVRWLCLKSASCAHREWPLLENVGLDVCVKPAAPSVDLDTGSLTVWYICLHSPPLSSELRNQKRMVLTDRRPWLEPGSRQGESASLVRLPWPTRGGRCSEPVRGPGNPQNEAGLIPEMCRMTYKRAGVWTSVWEIEGKIGIPKERNMFYTSWGQILCSWFGEKNAAIVKHFLIHLLSLFRRTVMSDSSTPWTAGHQASLSFTTSVGDAIQPSCPLSFTSPPTFNFPQPHGLF